MGTLIPGILAGTMEKLNQPLPNPFKRPAIQNEIGELERVARSFTIELFVLLFTSQTGEMVSLSETLWSQLENTDSCRFDSGDWESVERYALEAGRDWRDLKTKMETGVAIDAPIVMKIHDRYHLVSGNTRLMVARALGITPMIFLFEVDSQG